MTIIREPLDPGLLRRAVRIYREKREPVRIKAYRIDPNIAGDEELVPVSRRMGRRAAWQIAWHQARQAQL